MTWLLLGTALFLGGVQQGCGGESKPEKESSPNGSASGQAKSAPPVVPASTDNTETTEQPSSAPSTVSVTRTEKCGMRTYNSSLEGNVSGVYPNITNYAGCVEECVANDKCIGIDFKHTTIYEAATNKTQLQCRYTMNDAAVAEESLRFVQEATVYPISPKEVTEYSSWIKCRCGVELHNRKPGNEALKGARVWPAVTRKECMKKCKSSSAYKAASWEEIIDPHHYGPAKDDDAKTGNCSIMSNLPVELEATGDESADDESEEPKSPEHMVFFQCSYPCGEKIRGSQLKAADPNATLSVKENMTMAECIAEVTNCQTGPCNDTICWESNDVCATNDTHCSEDGNSWNENDQAAAYQYLPLGQCTQGKYNVDAYIVSTDAATQHENVPKSKFVYKGCGADEVPELADERSGNGSGSTIGIVAGAAVAVLVVGALSFVGFRAYKKHKQIDGEQDSLSGSQGALKSSALGSQGPKRKGYE